MAKLALSLLVILGVQLSTAQYHLEADWYSELSETMPKTLNKRQLNLIRMFRNADTFPYLEEMRDKIQLNDRFENVTLSLQCSSDYIKILGGILKENTTDWAMQSKYFTRKVFISQYLWHYI